jgi:hypothetical protein
VRHFDYFRDRDRVLYRAPLRSLIPLEALAVDGTWKRYHPSEQDLDQLRRIDAVEPEPAPVRPIDEAERLRREYARDAVRPRRLL